MEAEEKKTGKRNLKAIEVLKKANAAIKFPH